MRNRTTDWVRTQAGQRPRPCRNQAAGPREPFLAGQSSRAGTRLRALSILGRNNPTRSGCTSRISDRVHGDYSAAFLFPQADTAGAVRSAAACGGPLAVTAFMTEDKRLPRRPGLSLTHTARPCALCTNEPAALCGSAGVIVGGVFGDESTTAGVALSEGRTERSCAQTCPAINPEQARSRAWRSRRRMPPVPRSG